ncbi:MAG: hypothetical protein CL843_17775 [Crocinitomicaceae bacterium]|nr:hypothetical protein [Crocinitomicaceae bacterium]|tara:strand:+ start:1325 stop:1774 length:450 start_codon:yes stop_codon:yes gene_type:complete
MKNVFIVGIFLLAFIKLTTAQEQVDLSQPDVWLNYLENDQLKINYKVAACHDYTNGIHRKVVLLEMKNKTNQELNVSWFMKMYFNDICKTCGAEEEYTYSIVLAPNETITSTCGKRNIYHGLVVNLKHLDLPNPTQITNFELSQIIIEE